MVRVVFQRSDACGHCNSCTGRECLVLLHGDALPGDIVEVEMPDRNMVRVSALAYGFPLAMLLLGMLVGYWTYRPLAIQLNVELYSALGGGVFLLAALALLHVLDRRFRFREEWQPHIVAVHKDKKN